MEKKFVFFRLSVPDRREIPPVWGQTLSDVERFLQKKGIEIFDMKGVLLKEGKVYAGSIEGIKYKYGFAIDQGKLVFLFSIPEALERARRELPPGWVNSIEKQLLRGFATQEFERLKGFQLKEVISNTLYVGTEW